MYTRVTGLASPGNTNSSTGSSHSNNESGAHTPAVWSQQQHPHHPQMQAQKATTTLNRSKEPLNAGTKINNHLLRNNLLSSSVRDLLSTTLHHPNPQAQQHLLLNDPAGVRSMDVNASYGPLIDRQSCKKVIRANEFEKMNTMVQSQSGSRFILTSDYAPDSAIIPPSTLIMRPGITTSRTVGSKISRPNAGLEPNIGLNAFESGRFFHMVRRHVTYTTLTLTLISLFLLSVVIFLLTRPSPPLTCDASESETASQSQCAISCPVLCSGRGLYVAGSCVCDEGWKGKECETQVDVTVVMPVDACESQDCNGRGTCVSGRCRCMDGWMGSACEQKTLQCPVPECSNRGTRKRGVCVCRRGFKGGNCELDDCMDPSCSGHGSCVEGQCLCDRGWNGIICSVNELPLETHANCTGQQSRPEGTECSVDCGKHGTCDGSRCVCHRGWGGDRCQENICDPKCHEHGKCLNSTCICNPGYSGPKCSINGCPADCSGPEHGDCISDEESGDSDGGWSCRCKSGWTGPDCSQALETSCSDNIDNDGDGLVDCADSECCTRPECRDSLMCLTSPEPLDILLRKPPPSVTASFYQKMKFLIEDGSVQSYPHRDEYAERSVKHV